MKIRAWNILLSLMWVAMLCATSAGQVRVVAQVDTSKDIYVGQNFQYMIIIDGDNKPGQVDMALLDKYNPRSAENQDISQTSINVINGRATKKIVKRYVMSYMLTAGKVGLFELPGVPVTIEGKVYRTNPVKVNILEPGKTDKLDLEVVLTEKQCYVGQPVIITVIFYVDATADVGEFHFNIPAFDEDKFYIEEADVTDPQARQFQLDTGLPILVSQRSVLRNGRQMVQVTFSKVLIPKKAGRIALGESSVSAAVAVGRAQSRDPFENFGFFGSRKQYKQFLVTAPGQELNVLPLPDQDKPADFYGLVGRYKITTTATPTKVNVGDPITLTIKIGGSKFLKPVQWPELEQMAANFKIPAEKASPTIENDTKVFTQTIRANNEQVTEIPAIPLAVFDPDQGRYIVTKSEPIKLDVAPTKVLTNADIESAGHRAVNKDVVAITKGLSANYEELDVLTDQAFSPVAAFASPGYAVVWSLPLLGLLASVAVKLVTNTSPEKQAAKRRRQACAKAVRTLKSIEASPVQERNELIVLALKQYIGDRFDKMAGSLTADDCYEVVAKATGDVKLAQEYRRIITNCEASRYAAAGQVKAIGPDGISELVRQVDKGAGRKR